MIRFFQSLPVPILILFFITSTSYIYAQTMTEREKTLELQLQQEMQKNKEFELKLLEEAYEGAIDPEDYIVGPGDYFSVIIWGEIQTSFQLPITAEGVLIIPTVGSLELAGTSLKQAREKVQNAILKKYKNTQLTTFLIKMRKIRVHVTGRISKPGTYIATPIDRLSDLLNRSGGTGVYSDIKNVRIRHVNGIETFVDYSAFQIKGDLINNPYMQAGDVIIVPIIDYVQDFVRVEGDVTRPGFYPFDPGESILDFLNRHFIINVTQKLDEVNIQRGDETILINMTNDKDSKTILNSGDLITINRTKRQVYVMGAVQKPGLFTYIPNLTAQDYVGEAGPTENAANMPNIKVRHIQTGEVEKGGLVKVHPGDVIEVPIRRSKLLSEYLTIVSQLATLVIAYAAVKK